MTTPNQLPTTHPYRMEHWEREIYGMPAFPMIATSDLAVSRAWYVSTLGFADVFTMKGPGDALVLAHLRWCRWGDVLLTQALTSVDGPRGVGITLNFMTLDVDALAERARVAGATILEGPHTRPWNARDVTIADLDGYRLNFTGPTRDANRMSFDDIVRRAQGAGG
ncbi:MAG TPA: VOC family protein [Gemmatimonadaceae bacterium]|nr:VOC family protein [Gemmatimonadaceae bacterium]